MITVLILDDNTEKITTITKVLVESKLVDYENIDVALATDDGRARLIEKQYDLLVLDLNIPNRVGQEAIPNNGCLLLYELLENEMYNMPRRIFGLTEFTELADHFKQDFFNTGIILIHYERASDEWKQFIILQVKQAISIKRAESNGQVNYDYDVAVVCALDVEFNAVQKLPWGFVEHEIHGDPTFYITGNIPAKSGNKRVVAAFCPRMGMSNAAVTAMKIIQNFRPKLIAMTGITGAVRGKANIGDVIVADECWDWGMGKWIRVNNKPVFEPGPHHLSLDADLRSSMVRLKRDVSRLAEIRNSFDGTKPETALNIVIGPVASGSAVIADQNMTDTINAHHRKLVGIEMESYAIYNAATECANPRPKAISLKAASDFADNQKSDEFRQFCCSVSAKVFQELVESYL